MLTYKNALSQNGLIPYRILLSLLCLVIISSCTKPTNTITIFLDQDKEVSPIKYGWHYEEIGMIGEGGLYAEMVRNRALEEANPPEGLEVENGHYANVPNPDGRNKKVYDIDPLVGWGKLPVQSSDIKLTRENANPLNSKNPHSLQIEVAGIPDDDEAIFGCINAGFFGMNLVSGETYKLSFYARATDFKGPLKVLLSDSTGTQYSDVFTVNDIGKEWNKHTYTFTAKKDTDKGVLLFRPGSKGTVWLDVVSLFPGNTWDNGQSVFRADIMQNLKDYAPDFIRFPGGCLVHGVNVETMYHWKETIGDIAERPGGWTKWRPNYRTDGLGYHEFYELCEYLGSDAMYVTPSGLVCTGWVFQDGESDNYFHPDVDVEAYIQDALDAIEYAIGPVTSEWGARRAENGHPKPFPLKYISIGNEDFGPRYYENYDRFYRAIHAKYPELKIIANSIIGRTKDRDLKRERLSQFKDLSTIKIFDEHYYKDIPWVMENYYKFDKYNRPGPDLFIGELGIRGDHPLDVMGEAVFMMCMERNADLDPMMADRPLMRNWTYVKGRGNPLYYHTNTTSFKTTNYYMSKLFRDNTIDTWYRSTYKSAEGDTTISKQHLFTSVGKDPDTNDLVIKVVNLTDDNKVTQVAFADAQVKGEVTITTLTARNDQKNTPDHPNAVVPKVETKTMSFPVEYNFLPRSLTIFRISE